MQRSSEPSTRVRPSSVSTDPGAVGGGGTASCHRPVGPAWSSTARASERCPARVRCRRPTHEVTQHCGSGSPSGRPGCCSGRHRSGTAAGSRWSRSGRRRPTLRRPTTSRTGTDTGTRASSSMPGTRSCRQPVVPGRHGRAGSLRSGRRPLTTRTARSRPPATETNWRGRWHAHRRPRPLTRGREARIRPGRRQSHCRRPVGRPRSD